jgi:hypothetical protein
MSHEELPPAPNPDPEQQVLDAAREVIDAAGPYEVARDERAMGEIQGALDEGVVNIIKEPNDAVVDARVAVDEATKVVAMEAVADAQEKMDSLASAVLPLSGENEKMSAMREGEMRARNTARSQAISPKFGKYAGFRRYGSNRYRPQ